MKFQLKLALGLALLALGLVPAIGMAEGPSYTPEYQPETPPPHAEAPRGHAYGYFCKGESKKHVKGEKGTAFSRCVKAMAQADHHEQLTAKRACRALSKKHIKGQKATAFSICVKGVAQMRKEESAAVSSSGVA